MHTTEKPYLYETCGKLSAFHHQDCTLERSRCKITTSSCISPTIHLFVYYHITERINNGPFQDHRQDCTLERLRCIITRDKIKAIKHKEEHLHKVVCIYSTIDHLAEIERRSRKRRKVNAMEGQHKRQRLDEEKTPYKQEVDEMFNVTI